MKDFVKVRLDPSTYECKEALRKGITNSSVAGFEAENAGWGKTKGQAFDKCYDYCLDFFNGMKKFVRSYWELA